MKNKILLIIATAFLIAFIFSLTPVEQELASMGRLPGIPEKLRTDSQYPEIPAIKFRKEYFDLVEIDRFTFRRPWDSDIIDAIILEAIGEPEEGIIAVAWVFKNRLESSMNIGSSGLSRKDKELFIYKQPQCKKDLIKKLWLNIDRRHLPVDPTNGAHFFENVNEFGPPYWLSSVELTVEIGNHKFYK